MRCAWPSYLWVPSPEYQLSKANSVGSLLRAKHSLIQKNPYTCHSPAMRLVDYNQNQIPIVRCHSKSSLKTYGKEKWKSTCNSAHCGECSHRCTHSSIKTLKHRYLRHLWSTHTTLTENQRELTPGQSLHSVQ